LLDLIIMNLPGDKILGDSIFFYLVKEKKSPQLLVLGHSNPSQKMCSENNIRLISPSNKKAFKSIA